jgi:cullin 1
LRPQTLVKTKVVKMDPAPPPEEEVPKIEKDAVFTINENFRSKKQKVNINIPMRREKEEENEETHKAVEEDRKLQIQVLDNHHRLHHHHHLLLLLLESCC